MGLDAKQLASIINTSSGRCWSSEVYNPVPGIVTGIPSSNSYNGGFASALMAKVSLVGFSKLIILGSKFGADSIN